ncbi:hypothetical protein WJ0W_003398 [Paenibacillus melissococcoides]|uniref:Uncharacterized protein n=1 Tax=Paenibacillus melissococcoides TaxID=2912268 RepID=A0ABN8U9L1_9BACL|nr:hypothetical protein WJ0W_003398 [Paenibacillus melissococcoides]
MDDRGQAWLIALTRLTGSFHEHGLQRCGRIDRLGRAALAEAYVCYNGEQCQQYRKIAILS